jgi:hypothetical protein
MKRLLPLAVVVLVLAACENAQDPVAPQADLPLAATFDVPWPDLDIVAFKVTKRVSLQHAKDIKIKLVVKNQDTQGTQVEPVSATVVGIQNSIVVHSVTRTDVFDPVGNGSSTFSFPAYMPTASGEIQWTVQFEDGDPDADIAAAATKVVQ